MSATKSLSGIECGLSSVISKHLPLGCAGYVYIQWWIMWIMCTSCLVAHIYIYIYIYIPDEAQLGRNRGRTFE